MTNALHAFMYYCDCFHTCKELMEGEKILYDICYLNAFVHTGFFLDDYVQADFPVFVQDMIVVSVNIGVQCMVISYLHRALNKVTQSANQRMHTFNFLFIKTYLKFLKTLLHVSVIRPSSGSL